MAKVRAAKEEHRRRVEAAEESLRDYHAAIARARASGEKQADLVRETGFTREHIRKICRAAGVE